MARANPPRLSRDTDRHGNLRWYVRMPGRPKVRLMQEYGTEPFWRAYRDALAGKITTAAKRSEKLPEGCFMALCRKYYNSPEFRALDGSTQSWRKRALDLICATKGALPVDRLGSKQVRALRDELADKPVVANQRLKAIKALFSWATETEQYPTNPARDVKLIKYKTEGHHSWSIDEVERFEARFPLGTKPRLAMALLFYTAGRREDAVRLGPGHVRDGRVRFTQAKNEDRSPVDMDMPAHPELLAAIAAGPIGSATFLVTQYGEPFTPNGFGNWFADQCEAAGVPGRAHGLRKAIAARLAESQATSHELMAVTGHQTLQEAERYAKAARKPQMADTAMAKLQRASIVPPKPAVGQTAQKSIPSQGLLVPMARRSVQIPTRPAG